MLSTEHAHVLVASGNRQYTFLPCGEEVTIRYLGPRHNTETVVPVVEARDLWSRLLKRGFKKW
jgi:hypothetical protein